MIKPFRNTKGLYIVLISIHGLMRSKNLELGRDADTGGQIKYLIELANALINHPDVGRVDVLTRQVFDNKVDKSYANPVEKIKDGATIFRIPCGPKRYLRKEVLWPYLDNFTDRALQHIRGVGRIPDIIHSHYADGGFVGSHLAGLLGIPLIHTGHSLGRDKHKRLIAEGVKPESIEKQYNMNTRIEAEEYTLDMADQVIASTHQEIERQYQLYDNYQPRRMAVIPPGVSLDQYHPPNPEHRVPAIKHEIDRFLNEPDKPMILALARADYRKNVQALIRAYGESKELQEMANLTVLLGTRNDLNKLAKETKEILTDVLIQIDRYDLYGKIAYPKSHKNQDIPELYQLATQSRGVFVNPALTEPFGLTIIEAAACGLPVVATKHGGPVEIIKNCKNGELVDPTNTFEIQEALLKILSTKRIWNRYSKNGAAGAQNHYSWPAHANQYMKLVTTHIKKPKTNKSTIVSKSRMPTIDRLLICDIDNTLIGDGSGLKVLLERIQASGENVGLGVATGRHLESAKQALREWEVPNPDVLITSVGTEVKYGRQTAYDEAWWRLIQYRWQSDAVKQLMLALPGLRLQPRRCQSEYKISFYANPDKMPSVREIKKLLRTHDLHANVIYSHQAYLDILPVRASKGAAVRYVADKWGIPLEHILVAGDSGNDLDMLSGNTLGIVVANHSSELKRLKGRPRIYFAKGEYAWGINEGLDYYNFLGKVDAHDEQEASTEFATTYGLAANMS